MQKASKSLALEAECVFSSDIDEECRKAYEENFRERPEKDITEVNAREVPDHDILLAGFPCQPFSIIGHKKGFEDTRGTLFFDIARILEAKTPSGFVLENVKLLEGHDSGKTLKKIRATLTDLGYFHDYKVLNALDFGLPQKRERIWIVGTRRDVTVPFPEGKTPMRSLSDVLEESVPKKFYASSHIRKRRLERIDKKPVSPSIWHENKAGHVSAYPYSCALRAGASYNYLLVDGKRRLTPREMLRLQGFPETFRIACNDYQTRKQAGNSLPVNVATAVLKELLEVLYGNHR